MTDSLGVQPEKIRVLCYQHPANVFVGVKADRLAQDTRFAWLSLARRIDLLLA